MIPRNSEILSLTEVGKWFWAQFQSRKWAVKDLSLTVKRGEIVGLLGPNGSGKSTTIKMVLGFLRPSSGTVEVMGRAPTERASRSLLGYLPENPRLPRFLTAEQCLRYFGQLYGLMGRALEIGIDRYLELVRLQEARREKIGGFSKGMVQRLAFAQCLLNDPPILILDEPMSGLDPLGRMEMRNLLQTLQKERPDSTILFSSHILSDVEELCSSVILLKNGQMITQTPISTILEQGHQLFEVLVSDLKFEDASSFHKIVERAGDGRLRFLVTGVSNLIPLLQELQSQRVNVVSVRSRQNRLEELLFGEGTALAL